MNFSGKGFSLLSNQSLVAAPMAGISDRVFRKMCREYGADVVVSEMVSVEGILYGAAPTYDLFRFDGCERPIGIQLFGSDPEHFKKAAAIVADRVNPDYIDINSGCPAPKVLKKNGGASLLKNINLFEAIVKATVEISPVPVTVKIRSGWNKFEWVDREFAQCAESVGAAAITVHPRSQTMMFTGHSFWDRIALVKQSVKIPVVGNGDVLTADDAVRMFKETACDAIMIGRGLYGNPWLFLQIKQALAGNPVTLPTFIERKETALLHIARFRAEYGEAHAVREMKKHAAWYIKGAHDAAHVRDAIFRSADSTEIEAAIIQALG